MAKNVTISVDEEVYEQAKAALKGMGLTFSSGVELFLRAVAREDAIPFPVKRRRLSRRVRGGHAARIRLLSIARLIGFSTLALAEGTRWGSIPQAREREGGKTRFGVYDAGSTALWEGAR